MRSTIVIFGITGDLSRRKLLPALNNLAEEHDFSVVGVSRRKISSDEVIGSNEQLKDRTSIFTMDLAEAGDYEKLRDYLALGADEQALMYLAVPPGAAADIVDFLGQAGLNDPNVKILFEKPFGFDLVSAEEFIERTSRHYEEMQLYRIDHYMAKEVAQEIIRLRSTAENHHHHWGASSVSRIDIIAGESIGVEDRAEFYEQTGALRDFLQGHLMQLLSLIIMPIEDDFSLSSLPAARLKALAQLELANPGLAKRAQYDSYQDEVANPGSLTETLASVTLESSDVNWKDVPLHLATGKGLSEKRTYIKVSYTDGFENIFEEGPAARDAYEHVLESALKGQKAIFTTSPEVLSSWRVLQPIQEAWAMDNTPLETYKKGAVIADILPDIA